MRPRKLLQSAAFRSGGAKNLHALGGYCHETEVVSESGIAGKAQPKAVYYRYRCGEVWAWEKCATVAILPADDFLPRVCLQRLRKCLKALLSMWHMCAIIFIWFFKDPSLLDAVVETAGWPGWVD